MDLEDKKCGPYPTPSQSNFMNSEYKKIRPYTTDDKKGGPYTTPEQEHRRKQVYELHFERGLPAIKIAEILNVNRNTINADIKDWYSIVSKELPDHNASLFLKQIHRLEMQRARILDELEKSTEIKEKFTIERLLFAINSKITSEMSKIVLCRRDVFYRLRNND